MATSFVQQARQRKMIYFGAIAVLFTLSLIQREYIVKPQALRLQLRETARGEVELTSSAVRLMLTGSRGLAVTMLWYTAMDRQKRNEWHELELLVKSITKLQPYFITPWLYQSWNIAFNVAVECDKPRDKYYYISRGLELLAEGERRNRGTGDEAGQADPNRVVYPGHPELRHFMGFTYQLKIGTSDERLTMRCLLEMSCIDPVERHPDRFVTRDERGRTAVKLDKFAEFCQKYPRLVRRLREQLGHEKPQNIVKFLEDHIDIPNRFKPFERGTQSPRPSELKDPLEQFPILPPPERSWPNPLDRDLTSESVDVFLVCRTWYEFAQKPLPPPDPSPTSITPDYDKLRYRLPKQMVTQLFRQYPARAQVYIAETLESEGFFDREGWEIPDWFQKIEARDASDEAFAVGRDSKYHSGLAWDKSFEMYKDFGIRNGVYLSSGQMAELSRTAENFRANAIPGERVMPEQLPPARPEWPTKFGASYDAHVKVYFSLYYRRLANFDAFFYQAEGERDPITVSARKALFHAERKRKREVPSELMLAYYDEAWPLYVFACLKYPRFAQVSSMQEDFYEIYQQYLGATQDVHKQVFKQTAVRAAHVPIAPIPDWKNLLARVVAVSSKERVDTREEELHLMLGAYLPITAFPDWKELITRAVAVSNKEVAKGQEENVQFMLKVGAIRKRTGTLDRIQYYHGPAANELRDFLFLWTQGANLASNMSVGAAVSHPSHSALLLTRMTDDIDANPPPNWLPLITEETRRIAANRLRLDR